MATLTELRNKVRSQTETNVETNTDYEIDGWLQEAYNRTIAAETNWPFFEKVWSVTQIAETNTISLPFDLEANGLVSVVDDDNQVRLEQVDQEWAEDHYYSTNSVAATPFRYSLWQRLMYLWPNTTFTENRTYTLRGWRRPGDWIALGASAVPDCDERLHLALANYAIALAYAQQEDTDLEANYMNRWQRDVEIARSAIMEPAHNRPLTMGPRSIRPAGTLW